jgi:uncharacterized membrane-anchored protein YjiN (DUF445 family)
MTSNFENQVADLLDLREKLKATEAQYKELEEAVKNHMIANSINKVSVSGHTVSLVQAEQRSFDAETLQSLISAATFKQITEPKVSTSLFDAAVSLGKIPTDIAEKVTNKKPYSQLRVK